MIAGRLTMRALVERDQATGSDAWNSNPAADFQSIGDPLPCFIWSENADTRVDGAKTAGIERFRSLFALGADLAEGDEIASVTDRQGAEIIPGRLKVDGPVQRKHTHLEANLWRVA